MDSTDTSNTIHSEEPLCEDDFEAKQSNEQLLIYLKAMRDMADSFNDEYGFKRDCTDGDIHRDSFSILDHARKYLGVIIQFLETSDEKERLSAHALNVLFPVCKRYAESLGPVLVSVGILFVIEWRDTRRHRCQMQSLKDQLDAIDYCLTRLKNNFILISSKLQGVGEILEKMVKCRDVKTLQIYSKEVDNEFLSLELNIATASDTMRHVEKLIPELASQLKKYHFLSMLQYGFIAMACSGVSLVLHQKQILDTKGAITLATAGAVPLAYFYFYLSLDIDDLIRENSKRKYHQECLKMEHDDMHRRLQLLKNRRLQEGGNNN